MQVRPNRRLRPAPGSGPRDMLTTEGPDQYFSEEHIAMRAAMRKFVAAEIVPNIEAWEDAGRVPRETYRKAGEIGLIGVSYPEELGGLGGDPFMALSVNEEICRCGSGGVVAALGSHAISMPLVVAHGTAEQKRRFVAPVVAGEKRRWSVGTAAASRAAASSSIRSPGESRATMTEAMPVLRRAAMSSCDNRRPFGNLPSAARTEWASTAPAASSMGTSPNFMIAGSPAEAED